MAGRIRLDKFLADMGKGTRSQMKEAAKKGRILVNGAAEKKTDRKIDPDTDEVTLDGVLVTYQQWEYYMLNKPQGVVSATEDRVHKTVLDLLEGEKRKDLFPVGRLDIDTEGLLLLTNDGDLAHRLLAPKNHVDKEYYAHVKGDLPRDSAARMAAGMLLLDGTPVLPAHLRICKEVTCKEVVSEHVQGGEKLTEVILTIQEGKFHQVKRMFETLGCQVTYLKRISMGSLRLDESLKPGESRRLTEEELAVLKNQVRGSACVPTVRKQGEIDVIGTDIRSLLRQKRAVIFDLDGTLVDSMWMWYQIDVEYLGRFGCQCPPTLQKEIEGMGFTETAIYFKELFHIPDSLEKIKQDWIDMSIEKYRSQVPLKKGARRFLEYLKQSGIRMGIATSNGTAMVDVVLDSLGIRDYFQVVTTACEVAAGKPAPDIYLKVAETLNVRPDECMVFEDVPAGILAGKAAGMFVCAIEDDHSAHMRQEKQQLADAFIEDYEELLYDT